MFSQVSIKKDKKDILFNSMFRFLRNTLTFAMFSISKIRIYGLFKIERLFFTLNEFTLSINNASEIVNVHIKSKCLYK